jgi:hypothetical protein
MKHLIEKIFEYLIFGDKTAKYILALIGITVGYFLTLTIIKILI